MFLQVISSILLVWCLSLSTMKARSEYCFAQQTNDNCYTMPMKNLYILDRILEYVKQLQKPTEVSAESASITLKDVFAPASSVINWFDWRSRREWLGDNFGHYYPWMRMFNEIYGEKVPFLRQYILNGISKAPILPHFYSDKKEFAFSIPEDVLMEERQPSKNEFFRVIDFNLMPYFFVDMSSIYGDTQQAALLRILGATTLPTQRVTLPLGRQEDQYFLYNAITNDYDHVGFEARSNHKDPQEKPLEIGITAQDQDGANIYQQHYYDRPPNFTELDEQAGALGVHLRHYHYLVWLDRHFAIHKKWYALPGAITTPYTRLLSVFKDGKVNKESFGQVAMVGEGYKLYGFDEIGVLSYTPFSIVDRDVLYAPFAMGLFKLMFLTMGIDSDNELIGKRHSLYNVYENIRSLVDDKRYKDHHLWSSKYLDRNRFLPYHIAAILKKSKSLKEKLIACIDVGALRSWQVYEGLMSGKYYNKDGSQLKPEEFTDYLPGEEQVLAFILCRHVRFLWYGIMSDKAFYEETISPETAELVDIAWSPTSLWSSFNEKKTVKGQRICLLDVWKEIRSRVLSRTARRNFISFEGHGWVVCFDDELISLQASKLPEEKGKILKSLACTGIESSYSAQMDTFYKRERGAVYDSLKQDRVMLLEIEFALVQLTNSLLTSIEMDRFVEASKKEIQEKLLINARGNVLSDADMAAVKKIKTTCTTWIDRARNKEVARIKRLQQRVRERKALQGSVKAKRESETKKPTSWFWAGIEATKKMISNSVSSLKRVGNSFFEKITVR